MHTAEKITLYDAPDGRFVVELYRGQAYLHLEVRQWGVETLRKMRALWVEFSQSLANAGVKNLRAYYRRDMPDPEKWVRFMRMFGFSPMLETKNWMMMEREHGSCRR